MFAALVLYFPVYPLGGLLALLHAVCEHASDSYKYCNVQRRPVPDPLDDVIIEVWLDIFDVLAYLGVCTSAALIWLESGAWTGLQLVLAEHFLLFFKGYLSWSIPDCPEWIIAEEVSSLELLREDNSQHRRTTVGAAEGVEVVPPPEMLEVRPVSVQGMPPRLGGMLQRHPVIRLKHGDQTYNTKVAAEEGRSPTVCTSMTSTGSLNSDRGVLPESAWHNAFWFSLPLRPGESLIAEVLSEEHSLLSRRTKYVVLGSATFSAAELPRDSLGSPVVLQNPLEGASVMPGASVTLELRCV